MAVTITTIGAKDNLSKSRTDINNNFSNIKDELDLIEAKVNPSTGNLAVSNATFEKGARSVSTEIVTNEASERIKGTLAVEGATTLNGATLANGTNATINSGNVNINGSGSNLNVEGNARFDRHIILKDYGDASLDASNTGTYTSVSANVGLLDITGKHAITLDFSNYSASANVENTNDVLDFRLPTGTYQGQVLELLVHAGSSVGAPHSLRANNIGTITSSNSIQFQEDYGSVTLRYVGNVWAVTSIMKANIA